MPPDQAKLDEFAGKVFNDMGAAATGAMVLIGDKLGLYKALAQGGPLAPAELAARTGTAERYVREWLAAQAAAGYVQYRPETGAYAMTTEQAMVLADDASPAFMAGGFEVVASMFKDEPKISAAFGTGQGVGWHEHSPCLFRGTERFFRAGLRGSPGAGMAAGASRGCGRSWNGAPRSRTWAAATGVEHSHGPGVPQLKFHWLRLSWPVGRAGPRGRAKPGSNGGAGLRSPTPRAIRRRLRPRRFLRLLTRHGRSGWAANTCDKRSPPTAPGSSSSLMPATPSKTTSIRSADLLRRLDDDLRAGVPEPGGRDGIRRPSRPSAAAPGSNGRGL